MEPPAACADGSQRRVARAAPTRLRGVTTAVTAGVYPVGMTLVILTRHAERADGLTETNTPGHPQLSKAGKARAHKLAHMLADAEITDIFISETRRTLETSAPLAQALGLTPQVVPYGESKALAARIKSCAGDTVFVVGHMDSVPQTIDNLFIYVPATKTLTRIRY